MESLKMESPKMEIQFPGCDTYFIHFDTVKECEQFQVAHPGDVAHTCCNGKGCRLVKIGSWDEMHRMKKTFLATNN